MINSSKKKLVSQEKISLIQYLGSNLGLRSLKIAANFTNYDVLISMELLSPRLMLREWYLKDFQDFSRLAKNPNVMRYINNGELWDEHRIRKFIERQQRLQKQMGHCLWVIELQQKEGLIGFCGTGSRTESDSLKFSWNF